MLINGGVEAREGSDTARDCHSTCNFSRALFPPYTGGLIQYKVGGGGYLLGLCEHELSVAQMRFLVCPGQARLLVWRTSCGGA